MPRLAPCGAATSVVAGTAKIVKAPRASAKPGELCRGAVSGLAEADHVPLPEPRIDSSCRLLRRIPARRFMSLVKMRSNAAPTWSASSPNPDTRFHSAAQGSSKTKPRTIEPCEGEASYVRGIEQFACYVGLMPPEWDMAGGGRLEGGLYESHIRASRRQYRDGRWAVSTTGRATPVCLARCRV